MTWARTSRRPPWRAGLLVLAAHALLLGGMWQGLRTPWAPRTTPSARPAPLWLRWVPLPTEAPAPVAAAVPRPAAEPTPHRGTPVRPAVPAAATPPGIAAAPAAAPHEPQAITLPTPPVPPPAAAAAAEAEPAASTPPRPPPLNLALPARRGPAPPAAAARDRPAVPPASTGRDERLAAALGTDNRLRIERYGERLRFQQGRDCVDVRPARVSQLDPFNESTHPTPRQAEPCAP